MNDMLCLSPRSKATKVREILSTMRLSKCKKLHSILYSHWGPKADRADRRPIETNGKSISEYSHALLVHFGALAVSTRLQYVCVYLLVCCVYMCVRYFLGMGCERGQIAASLSHIIGQLCFIHKNKSTPPPSTYSARHDTCICPLLSSTNKHSTTHSVCMRVSACVSPCRKVWAVPNPP